MKFRSQRLTTVVFHLLWHGDTFHTSHKLRPRDLYRTLVVILYQFAATKSKTSLPLRATSSLCHLRDRQHEHPKTPSIRRSLIHQGLPRDWFIWHQVHFRGQTRDEMEQHGICQLTETPDGRIPIHGFTLQRDRMYLTQSSAEKLAPS